MAGWLASKEKERRETESLLLGYFIRPWGPSRSDKEKLARSLAQ